MWRVSDGMGGGIGCCIMSEHKEEDGLSRRQKCWAKDLVPMLRLRFAASSQACEN